MDIISFNEASTANGRIESFIENPDSTSGIVTVPKTIASGETITIPAGRIAVLPNVQVDGVMNIEGEVFVPSGSTYGDLEAQIATKAPLSSLVGYKNYIINGNFDAWQYKDAGLTYPQTSSGYGSDDRWSNLNVGSTKTHSQIACTDTERILFNASKFSRTVVTSVAGANNSCLKLQAIEDVTRLAGKTITLSFWAKADSNKNIAVEFFQNFGTGGTPSSIVTDIGSQLVQLTTTWQKKVITVTIPSIVGKTIGTDGVLTSFTGLVFWFDAGSSFNSRTANLGQQSGIFNIAQVQLEEGTVATPFEQRHIGLELSLCKRYFEVVDGNVGGYGTAGQMIFATKPFTQSKRVIPSMASLSLSGNNVNGAATVITASTLNYAVYNIYIVGTGAGNFMYSAYASAEL